MKKKTPTAQRPIRQGDCWCQPELRPLSFEPGKPHGAPQRMTCAAAIASLYGMTEDEYNPSIET